MGQCKAHTPGPTGRNTEYHTYFSGQPTCTRLLGAVALGSDDLPRVRLKIVARAVGGAGDVTDFVAGWCGRSIRTQSQGKHLVQVVAGG